MNSGRLRRDNKPSATATSPRPKRYSKHRTFVREILQGVGVHFVSYCCYLKLSLILYSFVRKPSVMAGSAARRAPGC